MVLHVFDTHYYIKQLESSGFSQQQAETPVKVITEMLENHVATKNDLDALELRLTTELKMLCADLLGNDEKNRNELAIDINNARAELKGEISALRTKLKGDIHNLRAELKDDMSKFCNELMNHSNKMLVATVGLLGSLMTLFHFLH